MYIYPAKLKVPPHRYISFETTSDREQRFIITIICALAAPVGTLLQARTHTGRGVVDEWPGRLFHALGNSRLDSTIHGPLPFCYSVQALFIGLLPNHYFPFSLISELMAPGGPGVGLDSNKPGSWNNFDLFYFWYFWPNMPVPLPAA